MIEKINLSITKTLSLVSELNFRFGNPRFMGDAGNTLNPMIPSEKPFRGNLYPYLKGQVDLIREEMYDELFPAIEENNTVLILDAIGDTITVVDGLAHKSGFLVPYYSILSSSLENDLKSFNVESVKLIDGGLFKKFEKFENFARYASDLYEKIEFNDKEELIGCKIPANLNLFDEISESTRYSEIMCLTFDIWRFHRIAIEMFSRNLGFDPLEVYMEVHKSNMTKFCVDKEDVEKTLRKYYETYGFSSELFGSGKENDLRVEAVSDVFVIKTNKSLQFGDKMIAEGKFLKGANFKEPDFSDLERFRCIPLSHQ